MEKIAIFNTKGGTGKSAVTVFLADFLSTKWEQRVLIVDLDPQQSSSLAILGEELLYEAVAVGKSLPDLMNRALDEDVPSGVTLNSIKCREEHKGRRNTAYLKPVNVLASEYRAWKRLNERLARMPKPDTNLLPRLFEFISDSFDVCLIDFPAGGPAPIVSCGLQFADWWLYPVVPDRAGVQDIEAPRRALREARRGIDRKLKGLGTLLSICQNRQTTEYRKSRKTLSAQAKERLIPRLFDKKSELLQWNQAREALDDTKWEAAMTLAKRYGGSTSTFYEAVRHLTKEVVSRLRLSAVETAIDDEQELSKASVTKAFQKA